MFFVIYFCKLGEKIMSDGKKLTVLLNDNDNVATALRDLDVGESTHNIKSINKIPKGHKISLKKNK